MKKIVNRRKTIIVLISLLLAVLFSGCDQEALFWDIAHEYPPIEPDIGGRPTKIVNIGTTLYVGNNTQNVWKYDFSGAAEKKPFWKKIAKSSFTVRDLAVANGKLFALSGDGRVIMYNAGSETWAASGIHHNKDFEKLFGAGAYLFGVYRSGSTGGAQGYSITCIPVDSNGKAGTVSEKEDTGLLMGAVSDGTAIYLGTLGDGLFKGSGPAESFVREPVIASGASRIVGVAVHNNKVFAVGPSAIYFPNGDNINTSYSLSGAVTGWSDGFHHLLMVGVQHSSDTFGYGYRELQIDNNGVPLTGREVPGQGFDIDLADPPRVKRLSSVKLGSQYVSAIGEYAVNYFYVMPPDAGYFADNGDTRYNAPARPVIFAATVKDGLWSYRTRNGEAQWNGEDGTGY